MTTTTKAPLRASTLWVFRVLCALQFIQLAMQPILAGMFLNGQYSALGMHSSSGGIMMVTGVLQLVAAVVLWRPGRIAGWPIGVAAALLVAELVQLTAGHSRAMALHLPLGTALIIGSLLVTGWAWRKRVGSPS
ncbi:hypothetical protein [Alloactinosynnema sp. L-07]|uniref:hypothetical protein n=1 Tax=Alloactinosynnema sp. L-07 TaxID=1653480 RepID=UPI00065EF0C3|nr:hypothetical protein [Alloactinosynnema sp. L-07]CRK57153.1 hypothetical protein [Alloactinosynnema sp. L-07]